MNMKKSIAAVSAGAMAISAMATVASANVVYHPANENATSAREQIVLTYDLAEYVEAFKPTSIKITTTYEGAEYLIKGLDIDAINRADKKAVNNGSPTGYTVVLGDILQGVGTKQYFIQTVELSAWSMDHKNPSMWNDGINGIRNKSKVWYSRVSLGKDISDMQNEAAAVEDHDHIVPLVSDAKGEVSEYAFQVRFEELKNSSAGDFILDEFKASDYWNLTAGMTDTQIPEYATFTDADTVKNTFTYKDSVTDKNNKTVKVIKDKSVAKDYEIVAVANGYDEATEGKVYFMTTVAEPFSKDADVSKIKAKGEDITDPTVLTADTKLYFTGDGFDTDVSKAALYDTGDLLTVTGLEKGDSVKLSNSILLATAYTGNVPEVVKGAQAASNFASSINNANAIAATEDTYTQATVTAGSEPATGVTYYVVNTGADAATNPYREITSEDLDNGKFKTGTKYYTKTAGTAASNTGKITVNEVNTAEPGQDPVYEIRPYDTAYVGSTGSAKKAKDPSFFVVLSSSIKDSDIDPDFTPEEIDNLVYAQNGGKLPEDYETIKAIKLDNIAFLTHWEGTNEEIAWKYSFNKFIVTSTFTVNYDGWDNAENYTGMGNNKKFVPLHNGIGLTDTADTLPTKAAPYGQETFYGTSSVNYNFPGAYNIVKPLHTTLTKPGDVIKALEARKDGGKHYTSPVTVLNDVVGNNEEVSFEFVSCSKYVRNTDYVHVNRGRALKYNGATVVDGDNNNVPLLLVNIVNPTTGENETRVIRSDKLASSVDLTAGYFGENNTNNWTKFYGSVDTKNGGMGKYDWYNPVFGQHLYTNSTYGTDNNHSLSTNGTGYPLWGPTTDGADQNDISEYYYASASDWPANALGGYGSYNYGGWNTNLFNGGLVINSNWTMQINDTKHFDWGNNSIIFFWSDLTADVNTHATNFLVAMQLYTPSDWYWDTLNVGVGAAAAENVAQVATTAGLEDEGEEVLDEEEIEEEPEEEYFEDFEEEEPEEEEFEDFEDFEDFEEPEEEEEEEPEEVEVEVEVKEVPSPKTGNSPIALAVIPVALAAAAIVAKKKND